MDTRAPTGNLTGEVLLRVSIARGKLWPEVKGSVGTFLSEQYHVGYIHIATPWLHLYISTEKWRELGRKAIKVSREAL